MADVNQMLPEVRTFLAQQPVKMFIDGKWLEATEGGTRCSLVIGCTTALTSGHVLVQPDPRRPHP